MPAKIDEQLLPAIRSLLSETLTEIQGVSSVDLDTYLSMVYTNPLIGFIMHYIGLVGASRHGHFVHDEPEIQSGIRAQLERMNGSLSLSVEELLAATYGIGYGVSNWGVYSVDGRIQLIDIAILNPKDYAFDGRVGAIEHVIYKGSGKAIKIPYKGPDNRIIHIINNRGFSFREPKGIATLERVRTVWIAWKIIMGELLVYAQRRATPILIGYSDSSVSVPMLDDDKKPILDENDQPIMISAPEILMEQLQGIDNRSIISTDLQNKIEALVQRGSGEFFLLALRHLQQLIFMGMLFPESIFTVSGSGDSGLNDGQRLTLDVVIDSLLGQISEGLLEGPIRFLIDQNYGIQESYGSFQLPPTTETFADKSLILKGLIDSIGAGLFDANSPEIIAKASNLIGIEAPTKFGKGFGLNLNYW